MSEVKNKNNAMEVPKTQISLSQDNSARNYIIVMVFVITVIIAVSGYLIFIFSRQYVHQSDVNKASDQLITSLQQKQKNIQDLKPNYDAITANNSKGVSDSTLILQALPTTPDYEGLIAILEKMGQNTGVKVSSISQTASASSASSTGTAKGGSKEMQFTLSVEGSYGAIVDFLKQTESSSRVINFNSMSLSGGSGSPLTASLTMTTYYKTPANIGSKTEPLK